MFGENGFNSHDTLVSVCLLIGKKKGGIVFKYKTRDQLAESC